MSARATRASEPRETRPPSRGMCHVAPGHSSNTGLRHSSRQFLSKSERARLHRKTLGGLALALRTPPPPTAPHGASFARERVDRSPPRVRLSPRVARDAFAPHPASRAGRRLARALVLRAPRALLQRRLRGLLLRRGRVVPARPGAPGDAVGRLPAAPDDAAAPGTPAPRAGTGVDARRRRRPRRLVRRGGRRARGGGRGVDAHERARRHPARRLRQAPAPGREARRGRAQARERREAVRRVRRRGPRAGEASAPTTSEKKPRRARIEENAPAASSYFPLPEPPPNPPPPPPFPVAQVSDSFDGEPTGAVVVDVARHPGLAHGLVQPGDVLVALCDEWKTPTDLLVDEQPFGRIKRALEEPGERPLTLRFERFPRDDPAGGEFVAAHVGDRTSVRHSRQR